MKTTLYYLVFKTQLKYELLLLNVLTLIGIYESTDDFTKYVTYMGLIIGYSYMIYVYFIKFHKKTFFFFYSGSEEEKFKKNTVFNTILSTLLMLIEGSGLAYMYSDINYIYLYFFTIISIYISIRYTLLPINNVLDMVIIPKEVFKTLLIMFLCLTTFLVIGIIFL